MTTRATSWVDFVLPLASAALCLAFPFAIAPAFQRMYLQFQIPIAGPTEIVLTWWVPVLIGVGQASVSLVALRQPPLSDLRAALGLLSTILAFAVPVALFAAVYASFDDRFIWATRW